MKKVKHNVNTKVTDILMYGQGYDDSIAELFDAFNQFRNGYYGLINYGDEWWEIFNQDSEFCTAMKREWLEVEKIELMDAIETMAKLMIGTYINFDAFTEVVVDASNKGKGTQLKTKRALMRDVRGEDNEID